MKQPQGDEKIKYVSKHIFERRTLIDRKTSLKLLMWTALSLIIIGYIIISFRTGYIVRLYEEDRYTYAFFSLATVITLGFCLGKLSELITDVLGLEIEKIEHFEG